MKKSDLRMDIDLVAQICGHFTDCETNNGYGCDHPENETENPKECHRIGCPVAIYDSDKDEMIVQDPKLIEAIKHGAINCDKTEYRKWLETVANEKIKETTPLACDKSKEPPCHLEPSTELCQKCPLNRSIKVET